jgi:GNAT superfamily N-acetyltransferase
VIRRICADDAALARSLRLRALATDPLSFGSTYEQEVERDDAFWAENARRHAAGGDRTIFLAFVGDTGSDAAIGLVRGARDESREGVLLVHSLWVAPESRRAGVAGALLATVEAWMREHGGRVAELMVTDEAPTAARLYRRAGYAVDGHTEVSPRGVIERRMQKRL